MAKVKLASAKPGSLGELRRQWGKDPVFMREWTTPEDEFALAERMSTRQSYLARLEDGRTLPSLRTLQKFASATRTKLRLQCDAG